MMARMNPFDRPPTAPPVSSDPPASQHPSGGGHDGPRRGRMALAALAAAGLVGGGVVVAGQFASADRPALDAAATVDEPADEPSESDEPSDEPAPESDERSESDEPAESDERSEPDGTGDGVPSVEGEIVIDVGDGEPLVLDLGEIGECLGPILDGGPMHEWDREADGEGPFDDEFHQRMEEYLDTLPWGELGDLEDDGVRIFGSGGSTITVVGPDGVEVIDLGEEDATVTIEQRDGELSIETEGDATVSGLPDLGGLDLDELPPGEMGELDIGGFLPFDLDAIESCLDDIDGGGSATEGS